MPKHTATLFPKTLAMLRQMGENIRLARLRRNITARLTAERAGISVVTLAQIERGAPTVAIGNYVQVLFTLKLERDILKVAADDDLGRKLQDLGLERPRKRARLGKGVL
jgi:transcriptional regulator with XRE-family HTH domain